MYHRAMNANTATTDRFVLAIIAGAGILLTALAMISAVAITVGVFTSQTPPLLATIAILLSYGVCGFLPWIVTKMYRMAKES